MSNDHDEDDKAVEKTNIFSSTTLKVLVEPDYQIPPCVVLLVGPSELLGRQWLIDKAIVTLGRSTDADVQVSEASLSKLHARFEAVNNKVFITDLGSTNCTFIDNNKLTPHQGYVLRNDNQIRVGSLVFKFLERGYFAETAEKARMQSELEKARTVQATLFPSEDEVRYEWVKIAGFYRAASECGGDWWWHWRMGDRIFALIGDATGHGAAAALITSAARSAVATIEQDPAVQIEKVYTTLSHAIRTCSGGKLTMSAFILEIDLRTRTMSYINASHLPAMVLPKKKQKLAWNALDSLMGPVSASLGLPEMKYEVVTTIAPISSRLVLLTDGLTEREDPQGNPLNERVFNSALIQVQLAHPSAPKSFLKALIEQSDSLAMQAPVADDITVVALDFD